MNTLIPLFLLTLLSPFGSILHTAIKNCSTEACATVNCPAECPQPICDPEACTTKCPPTNCKVKTPACAKLEACKSQTKGAAVQADQSAETKAPACKASSSCPKSKS